MKLLGKLASKAQHVLAGRGVFIYRAGDQEMTDRLAARKAAGGDWAALRVGKGHGDE